jgi:peptidoglycan/xylan/chitin deacetylase (PgdA/CDA1 family)
MGARGVFKTLKAPVLQAAKKAGFFAAVAHSRWRCDRLLLLGYHGVALEDEHQWNPSLYITADLLRRRLETLRQCGCSILPLGEAVERLYKGTLPPRSVVLTFDDGYFDFYRLALPLLLEYEAPATVYATSYYTHLDQPVFYPMLGYLLWKGVNRELALPEALGGDAVLVTPDNRLDIERRISDFVSGAEYSLAEKEALLSEIAGRVEIDYESLRSRRIMHTMTPGELGDIAARGIDIQLHTHHHRVPQAADLFIKEIEDNRRALDQYCKSRRGFGHFCYPSGVYHADSGALLRRCGIVSATTVEPGLASRSSDPYYLPRYLDCMNVDDIVFEAWVSGADDAVRRKVRRYGP